jgi:hypothetical protein
MYGIHCTQGAQRKNTQFFPLTLFLVCLCSGCTDLDLDKAKPDAVIQKITGRNDDETLLRTLIYQVKTPKYWERHDPVAAQSIIDTTLALCEFKLKEGSNEIRITIHNFPSDNLEERIPPIAQINRWKKQLDTLDHSTLNIIPVAHGGFSGLFIEVAGIVKSQEIKILAWSMQLYPEHYRNLSSSDPAKHHHFKQMRADYTIKAMGPPALIDRNKRDIVNFADSFELIEEIPSRP